MSTHRAPLRVRVQRFIASRPAGVTDADIYGAFPAVARATLARAMVEAVEGGEVEASHSFTRFAMRQGAGAGKVEASRARECADAPTWSVNGVTLGVTRTAESSRAA